MKFLRRKHSRLTGMLLTGVCLGKTAFLLSDSLHTSRQEPPVPPPAASNCSKETKPMSRAVILTEDANRRFKQAVLDWWIATGNPGTPGADRIAAALNCDRRTVMKIRGRKPCERSLLMSLFAAQAKKPVSSDYLALWELTSADYRLANLVPEADSLLIEAGQLYQGAEYDMAEKNCREALALYRHSSNRGGEANAQQLMGRLEVARGRFDLALEHIECALSINRTEKNVLMAADLYGMKETIFLRQGDLERSRGNFTESLKIWKISKDLHAIADTELNLVQLETAAKRASQARVHLENARNSIKTLKDAPLHAALLLQEARLLLLEGHPDAAADSANRALDYWTFADHPRWKALSHLVLAEISAKQCHAAAANHHAAHSLKLYEQVSDQYGAQQAQRIMQGAE